MIKCHFCAKEIKSPEDSYRLKIWPEGSNDTIINVGCCKKCAEEQDALIEKANEQRKK